MAIWNNGNIGKWKFWKIEIWKNGNSEKWKFGNLEKSRFRKMEMVKNDNLEKWKLGIKHIKKFDIRITYIFGNGNWRKFTLKNKNKRKQKLGEREIGQI